MPCSRNRKKPRMNANKRKYIVLIALLGTSAHAQWLNHPTPGTPRTRDVKANLRAPAPRASNGKPDLSGVWHVQPDGKKELTRLFGPELIAAADATSVPGMALVTASGRRLGQLPHLSRSSQRA